MPKAKRFNPSIFGPKLPNRLKGKLLRSIRTRVARAGWPVRRWCVDGCYKYDENERIIKGYVVLRASGEFIDGRRFCVITVATDELLRHHHPAFRVLAPDLARAAIEFLDAA